MVKQVGNVRCCLYSSQVSPLFLGLLLVTLLQYNHLMSRDMGINVPGLVQAGTWLPKETVEHVTDELRRQPMVEGVAVATSGVIGQYWTRGLMSNDGKKNRYT